MVLLQWNTVFLKSLHTYIIEVIFSFTYYRLKICFSNWKPLNPRYFDNQLLDRTSRKLALVWLWSIKGLPEVLVWAFCHKKVPLMMIQCCEPIFFQCYLGTVGWYKLKVNKSQKQNVKFSHSPKNQRNFLLLSWLQKRLNQKNKSSLLC